MIIGDNLGITYGNSNAKLNAFIIQYGLNGILPRIKFLFDSTNDEFEEVEHLKITYKSQVLVDANAYIYSRLYKNATQLEISAYLVPLKFVYGTGSNSYNSLNTLIDSLWTGKFVDRPNIDRLGRFNQMSETNHAYLTKGLLGVSINKWFYYDLKGNIHFVDINNSPDYSSEDLTDITTLNIDKMTNEMTYNPLFVQVSQESNRDYFSTAIIGQNIIESLNESKDVDRIYLNNKIHFAKYNDNFKADYFIPSISMGDLIDVKLTETVRANLRCVYTQYDFINSNLKCNSILSKINE